MRAPEAAPDEPGQGPAEPGPAAASVDTERRAFFLDFGKQTLSAVGQVAGMTNAASRTASAIANELLGLEESPADRPAFVRSGATTDPVVSAAAPAAEDAFRSAYRLAGEELVILDQRGIPEALDEVAALRGRDVAYYLRLGVARGGALMAQLAAYGLALTAAERSELPVEQRRVELLRTERALVESRPSSRAIRWAMERMHSAIEELPESTSGTDLAQALRVAADTIADDIRTANASVAAALVERLPTPSDRPLAVLLHGSQGALAGGLVGTGITALAKLRDAGRELRIFVTEGRPFMDGARLASWELRQGDLDHRIVPDSAVAWLLARERLDVVLISAEWIAQNGDVGALVGARGIAQLVQAMPDGDARPQVIVSGLDACRDPDTIDGAAIPAELRPAKDLTAYLADVPVRSSDALVPATDVVPAAAIDMLVTEHELQTGADS